MLDVLCHACSTSFARRAELPPAEPAADRLGPRRPRPRAAGRGDTGPACTSHPSGLGFASAPAAGAVHGSYHVWRAAVRALRAVGLTAGGSRPSHSAIYSVMIMIYSVYNVYSKRFGFGAGCLQMIFYLLLELESDLADKSSLPPAHPEPLKPRVRSP